MKKVYVSVALIFLVVFGTAQIAPSKYYVQFTDKYNSPYSTGNPSEYLSQRAIDRRAAQGIPVDERDLPVNPQYLQGVSSAGAVILNPTKWLNGVTIYTDDPSVLDAIAQLPYVAGVSVSNSGSSPGPGVTEKPFFSHENYQKDNGMMSKQGYGIGVFDYGLAYNQIHMIRGDQIHEMGYRGQGKVIAVLDAGFLNAHIMPVFDSLWNNNQILGTWDFVDGEEISFDEHPHGSMVLSCMGGNMPGQLIGTAPKASYWLLRSEDGGSEYLIEEYNWVSAAEFADSAGADIINSSLGYTEFNDPLQNHTYSDLDGDTAPATVGADIAASKGILVVNSLGNEGYSPWYYLSVPSDGDSVMGIGAVDGNGNYADFSSHGPSADGRTKPDVAVQGKNCWVAEPYSNSFTYGSGTSFASPILAGMAACLWQANPDQTNMQIADAIRQSGSQFLSPDSYLGYGIPDFILANNILTVMNRGEEVDLKWTVFPNPFRDKLCISFNEDQGQGGVEVMLEDISGRVIYSGNFSGGPEPIFIDVPEKISTGLYLLNVNTSKGIFAIKVIRE